MKNLLLLMLAAVLVVSVSCRQHDVRTAWVSVPDMKNQACADRIKTALKKVSGVEGRLIEIDLQEKVVLVPYQSTLLSMKNIEFYIAEVGFAANEIPADKKAKAALPESCR